MSHLRRRLPLLAPAAMSLCGNPLGQANALNNIGNVYRNQGKLEEALEFYQAALKIHQEIGHPLEQANALRSIGNVYSDQGKLEEALVSYNQALPIFDRVGNPVGERITH